MKLEANPIVNQRRDNKVMAAGNTLPSPPTGRWFQKIKKKKRREEDKEEKAQDVERQVENDAIKMFSLRKRRRRDWKRPIKAHR